MQLMRRVLCLLALLLGAGLVRAGPPPQQAANRNSSFVYNDYMASLSTSPQPFIGTFGHYHVLTAADLPALETSNAQMMLVSLKPCAAYTPHYQVNCGETVYVKSGSLDVVMLIEEGRLERTLRAGDVLTIPAGSMHSYMNTGCQEAESVVLITSATPQHIFPVEQALSMPQQAIISGFGLTNFTQFRDPINLPKAHLYSLNDPACSARCAALANQTGADARPGAAAGAAPVGAPAGAPSTATAAAAPAVAPAAAAAAAGATPRSRQGEQQQQPARRLAARAAAGGQAPARRLVQDRARRAGGASGGAGAGLDPGSTGIAGSAGAGRRKLLDWPIYNEYMGSLTKVDPAVENDFATRRQLTYKEMRGLEETDTQAVFTEFKACSMSAMHFQPNADEFTTVLTGTIDMILLVNGTRKVVRTMQPGDVAVIPRGVVHYFANANCDTNTMLVLFNSKAPRRVYPLTDLMQMPAEVLTAAFGLEGGAAAFPSWLSSVNVPTNTLGSLNDPQCTLRCEETQALIAEEEEAGGDSPQESPQP